MIYLLIIPTIPSYAWDLALWLIGNKPLACPFVIEEVTTLYRGHFAVPNVGLEGEGWNWWTLCSATDEVSQICNSQQNIEDNEPFILNC